MRDYQALLVPVSGNRKTGPMPVSFTEEETCPDICPLKKSGCYAEHGPVGLNWRKVTQKKSGTGWDEFCRKVFDLPYHILWRYAIGGDAPSKDGQTIDREAWMKLVKASQRRRGFSYTHYDVLQNLENRQVVVDSLAAGFVVNLSGNNAEHADRLYDLKIAPVVTMIPADAPNVSYTPAGRKIVACPAEKSDKVQCINCKICAEPDRHYIIGFRLHGSAAKKASTASTQYIPLTTIGT